MHNTNQDFSATESVVEPAATTFDTVLKEKRERRFQRGIKWMGAGALTLVLSFGINFLLFQSGVDFTVLMYSLTTIGSIGLLKGMADVFG